MLADHFDAAAYPDIATQITAARRAAQIMGDALTFFDDATVLERRTQLRDDNSDFLDNILFVAEDAGGALYGVWIRGGLTGMWTALDHDEIDLSPAWRDVDDLIASYPQASLPDTDDTASPADHARWAELREKYEPQYQKQLAEDPDGVFAVFFAFTIIALTPRADADTLVRFLTSDNQWIAERAAATLGGYKHQPAVAALTELSLREGNGALAARGALAHMGIEDHDA